MSPLDPRPPRRSALRSLRPLLLPAVLGAASVALGGTPGVLIGFLAILLVFDRVLDRAIGFTGWSTFEAENRFLRLSRERRRAELLRRLRRRPAEEGQLEYLADDRGWAAVARHRPLGLQTILVRSVVGTVDRQKAIAFDREFRPPRWSRGRWTLMCFAAQGGSRLPPISVYRAGDRHFVRDGHHRVSVARALGMNAIDAEVVELVLPHPADEAELSPRPAAGRTRSA
jgi:hypothetical protein